MIGGAAECHLTTIAHVPVGGIENGRLAVEVECQAQEPENLASGNLL